ncbi:MAG TPA: tail fiber domain-containing protein [Candidatus Kapabacteria bacterium]|jgi:hypothetical protein|nr:tail fiber domain-containing protein [Candidatus Kapabacteria bacterium]
MKTFLTLSFIVLFCFTASAQQSPTISYQGVIQNAGTPVNGTQTLRIMIYETAQGSAPLYSETQTVTVTNGIFDVAIGSVTPLKLDFHNQYWIAISVNGGAELTPRTRMGFAPYAFRAIIPAVGKGALQRETGQYNVALGDSALYRNTSGSFNTANGDYALYLNDTGSSNVAVGVAALYNNTFQSNLVAVGDSALFHNGLGAVIPISDGAWNTAIGSKALYSNMTGFGNTATGNHALYRNTTGDGNTAIGDNALWQNTTGYNNTAVGRLALNGDTIGSGNTATGAQTLMFNMDGRENTAMGDETLSSNLSGDYNTALGAYAMYWNTEGNNNIADGDFALISNTFGSYNVAIGDSALYRNTTGSNNIAVGFKSGPDSLGFSNTISFGSHAVATQSNQIVLGDSNITAVMCHGVYAATTAQSANMVVSSNGQIMRSTSSARYKTNIRDLNINTDRLYDLRPVSYTSKIDGKEYFGLVAEDVAKIIPDLAEYARAEDVIPGSTSSALIPDAVRYPMLSVLLLEELKKEHIKVEDLEHRIEALEEAARHSNKN